MKTCEGHYTTDLCPRCAVTEELVGMLSPLGAQSDERVHVIWVREPVKVAEMVNKWISNESNIICDGLAQGLVEALGWSDHIELIETPS